VNELKEVACNAFGVDRPDRDAGLFQAEQVRQLGGFVRKTLSQANLLDAQNIKLKPKDVSVSCCVLCLLCVCFAMPRGRVRSVRIWIRETLGRQTCDTS